MGDVPDSWIFSPSFCDETLLELPAADTPSPEQMIESELQVLKEAVGDPPSLIVSLQQYGSSAQSAAAKQRYHKLMKLQANHEGDVKRPLLFVLLAECHYFLFDNYGAYLQAKRALELLEEQGSEDSVLRQAVEYLRLLSEPEPDDWEEDEEAGLTIMDYKRPAHPNFDNIEPLEITPLALSKLELLQKSDVNFTEFARLACVSSNELEAVFSLTGDSVTHLVKRGFIENAIEGISTKSRIKRKQQVLKILENTMACFPLIVPFVTGDCDNIDTNRFSEQTLKRLHSTLLQSDDVYSEEDEDGGTRHILVPAGIYRRTPCYASHATKSYVTHFCSAPELEKEMAWYLPLVQSILTNPSKSPFHDSAWIQWAFVTIHPFADGNGRVARILSSIPLLRASLPPVVVMQEQKKTYFKALHDARCTGSVSQLALFLRDETDRSIDWLFELRQWHESRTDMKALNVARLRNYKGRVIVREYD